MIYPVKYSIWEATTAAAEDRANHFESALA
jgi:hypothetical protein